MKKLIRIILPVLILQINFCFTSNAQVDFLGTFLAGGEEDAEKLLEAYLSPMINAFGASMTGGWYNTAKPHKLGGFDITITSNVAFIPDEYETFVVDDLELTNLTRAANSSETSPTISGPKETGSRMRYNTGNVPVDAEFNFPEGVNLGFVPSPMIQLGIGFVKGTEITGRLLPKLKYGEEKDNDLFMWGLGLKHDVKQWIPAMEKLPVLNIALQGGYTSLKANMNIEVDPDAVGLGAYDAPPAETWEDQNLFLKTTSFTANLIVSADLPVVTFYGGVGFATTKTNIDMEGNYPILEIEELTPVVGTLSGLSVEVKNQDGGVTKPRLNIGMRLKLGVLTLHGDYTRSNFNAFTAGIGISFR